MDERKDPLKIEKRTINRTGKKQGQKLRKRENRYIYEAYWPQYWMDLFIKENKRHKLFCVNQVKSVLSGRGKIVSVRIGQGNFKCTVFIPSRQSMQQHYSDAHIQRFNRENKDFVV